jgi:hypothetical protein
MMMYYEVLDNETGNKNYYHHETSGWVNGLGHIGLSRMAHRIWREELDKVLIVKDRQRGIQNQECDLKEFMWIKLSARPSEQWKQWKR